jgi:prepilin peptidase CpaA
MTDVTFQALAVACSLVAAFTDWKSGRIPNWLTLPTMAGALVAQVALRGTWGATESLAGLLLCGGVPWLVFRASDGQAIGGGDVKLFGALGALLGPTAGLELELESLVLLLGAALVRLAFRGDLSALLRSVLRLVVRRFRNSSPDASPVALTEMRLGPAIALAAVLTVVAQRASGGLSWLL